MRLCSKATNIAKLFKNIHTIHVEAKDYDPELVISDVPVEASWDPTKLNVGITPTVEHLSGATTNEQWEFEIDLRTESSAIIGKVADDVRRRLHENPGLRSSLVAWSFRFANSNQSVPSQVLTRSVQRLWDGLRTLPFTDDDIAIGMANCVGFFLCRIRIETRIPDPWLAAASSCFGVAMEIEFGAEDASYSRAYVSRAGLLMSVRDDIEKYLAPAYKTRLLSNMTGLLQAIKAPRRLFHFDRLIKLFAQQIAPSQVLIRFAGDSKHPSMPIFFSPARLDKLGLP